MLEGTKTVGGRPYRYGLMAIVNRKAVTTCEVWGPADAVERDHAALRATFQALPIKP